MAMLEYPSYQLTRMDSRDPESILEHIDEWVHSLPVRDLLKEFGGAFPTGRHADSLRYLEAFSAEHWDFRKGRERYQSEHRAFDPGTKRLVHAAAYALGLGTTTFPSHDEYRHVLILGGKMLTCMKRAEFALDLLRSGMVEAPEISGLGSFRKADDGERAASPVQPADGLDFEVDAMEAAMVHAFTLRGTPYEESKGDPYAEPNRSWKFRTYSRVDGLSPRTEGRQAHVVAADASNPEALRANTADTCRFWADRVAVLEPGDRVLVVTTAIFVPFQHCDAVATLGLPYQCVIDTVGIDLEGPEFRTEATATGKYLQEIRSAIVSMLGLREVALQRRRRRP
ncbi:hypothetical protein [Glycomyces tritici]|uniref:Uncharacterized protein n=1 Tax=Glycomyces tritici TaxID=2665176 RepID=A0ABT7YIP7_9ACTN|nr:hypothetical protein [Glycomyces tritici]MDN3238506.1 hypothetical protein [Glycomyces tritici]